MARQDALFDSDLRQPGFRVERPRADDAIGRSLRDAYARDPRLPEEMAAILRRLDAMAAEAR